MPSKYSHSVVLAQQSSRGLISLPNDQYIDYSRSSPLFTTKPPPQPTTSLPRKNSRATSTRTTGSDRLPAQNTLRQQSSFDQLAADAYQHQPGYGRLHDTPQRLILDSEEDDEDGESLDFDRQSEAGRPSNEGSSIKSPYQNARQIRIPQRLPIEVQQQVVHRRIHSAAPQNLRRTEQKAAIRPMPALEPETGPSFELPIQRPPRSGTSQLHRNVTGSVTHRRDLSIPKSLATPQLSPSGTEMSDRGDSPATPFSSLQREATPALADEHRTGLSRENSKLLQKSRVPRPAATNMPSQANFDDFVDDTETVGTYFKDLPEPQDARNSRLANMRAFDVSEKAVNYSTTKENRGSSRDIPAAANFVPDLRPPTENRFRDREGSLSSLSSLSNFGSPPPRQTTRKSTTYAGAMERESLITAQQALREFSPPEDHPNQAPTLSRKKSTTSRSPFAALSKTSVQSQLLTAENLFAIPSVSPTPFKQHFDPSLLEANPSSSSIVKPTLAQFLRGLESPLPQREFDNDNGDDTAAPPPDIARHHVQTINDPLAHLIIDSRGGVTTIAAQGHHHPQGKTLGRVLSGSASGHGQEKKGGRFSSLTRFKGRKR